MCIVHCNSGGMYAGCKNIYFRVCNSISLGEKQGGFFKLFFGVYCVVQIDCDAH